MRLLLLIIVGLVLAAPAVAAPKPEAHPSCRCKARWDHGAYTYRSVVFVTIGGDRFVLPSVCRVNPRTGGTWCRIVSAP